MSSVNKSGKRFVPKASGRRNLRTARAPEVSPRQNPASILDKTTIAKQQQDHRNSEERKEEEINSDEEDMSDAEELNVGKAANEVFKPLLNITNDVDSTTVSISTPVSNNEKTEDPGRKNQRSVFIQPPKRLNSLSTPTQLLDPTNNNVTSTSRRNSSIQGRRPSIVKTSRRGSTVIVDDVSVGGVITGNNNDNGNDRFTNNKLESNPISMGEPIKIPLKQRRKSSIAGGKRKRRNTFDVNLNDDVSGKVKQRVVEAIRNVNKRDALKDMDEDFGPKDTANLKISESQVEASNEALLDDDLSKKGSNDSSRAIAEESEEDVPDVVVISQRERRAKYKWMMSKTQGKLVKVDVSLFEVKTEEEEEETKTKKEDSEVDNEGELCVSSMPIKKDYSLNFKIDDVKQLRELRLVDDAHLTQHIKINEEKMTMADLCKPFFPIGEISKDYERAVEGERKRIARQKKIAMERKMARRYRLSEKEFNKLQSEEGNGQVVEEEEDNKKKIKDMMDIDTESQNKSHNVPLLQIQNGRVVYSQESTLVNRHGDENNTTLERVEENPYENIVTSNTYSKKKQTLKWTPQETAELFKAVSLWGTDFSLIAQLFPYRTRKQIKAKFVLEEKKHPHLVEFALLRKLPVDIDEYSGKSGKEFKTLDEYNAELKKVKEKHEEELKTMAVAREKALVEDREAQETLNSEAFKPRNRKAVIAEFRKNEEVVGSLD